MKNTFKIIWSDEALHGLNQILNYLEENWTPKEIKKFAKLLDKKLNLISNNPDLFQVSKKSNNIRKSVISKQTSLFYKVENDTIYLITLFDNRKDPKSLKI